MYLKHLTLILLSFAINSLTLAQCPTTDIFLNTQADIDDFSVNYPGCTAIPMGVNVFISGNYGLTTNLNGLSSITSIGGDLQIEFCWDLTNLSGLSNLMSIGGDLIIQDNTALINIDDLSALTSVGGAIQINNNDMLTDVDGLSALISANSINISSNPALTHVLLPSLTSVGSVFIFENSILTSVDFSSLSTVGQLVIRDNVLLTNIDGLSGLMSVGGDFILENNPQLSMCCVLCPLLQADADDDTVIGNTTNISNNAAGCDEADIYTCPTCTVCAAVDLDINFDSTPTQTSWELTDDTGNVIASSGGNIYGPAFANTNLPLSDLACLTDGCYDLTFNDNIGNGMCPFRATASSSGTFITPGTIITPGTLVATLGSVVTPGLCGNYVLRDANGNVLASGGGGFGSSQTTNFCVSAGVAVPLQNNDIYARTLTESTTNTLEILPNPARDNLTIYYNLSKDLNVDIHVIDITGKIVGEIERNANDIHQTQIDISDLTPGFYFVKLVSGDIVLSEKFVKQ